MDEEKTVGTEVSEADLAAFDEDWDGGETEVSGDAEEPQTQESEKAGEETGTEAAEGSEARTDTSEDAKGTDAVEPGQPWMTAFCSSPKKV